MPIQKPKCLPISNHQRLAADLKLVQAKLRVMAEELAEAYGVTHRLSVRCDQVQHRLVTLQNELNTACNAEHAGQALDMYLVKQKKEGV